MWEGGTKAGTGHARQHPGEHPSPSTSSAQVSGDVGTQQTPWRDPSGKWQKEGLSTFIQLNSSQPEAPAPSLLLQDPTSLPPLSQITTQASDFPSRVCTAPPQAAPVTWPADTPLPPRKGASPGRCWLCPSLTTAPFPHWPGLGLVPLGHHHFSKGKPSGSVYASNLSANPSMSNHSGKAWVAIRPLGPPDSSLLPPPHSWYSGVQFPTRDRLAMATWPQNMSLLEPGSSFLLSTPSKRSPTPGSLPFLMLCP